jgi:hypothetical protein
MGRPGRALEAGVIQRAGGRCEYCHFPQIAAESPFHVDHIIAEKHRGLTNAENLAWACFSCSLRKGPNIAGRDPASDELTRLFHPRNDLWGEHFAWDGAWLRGKTPVGRTTVAVLDINHPDALAVREALLDEGVAL